MDKRIVSIVLDSATDDKLKDYSEKLIRKIKSQCRCPYKYKNDDNIHADMDHCLQKPKPYFQS